MLLEVGGRRRRRQRLKPARARAVGCVGAAAAKRHRTRVRRDGSVSRESDEIGPREARTEHLLDAAKLANRLQCASVRRKVDLGGEADASAVAAALVVCVPIRGRATVRERGRVGSRQERVRAFVQCCPDLRIIDRLRRRLGQRELERLRGWHPWPDTARVRPHVPRHQLVPGRRKCAVESRGARGERLVSSDLSGVQRTH